MKQLLYSILFLSTQLLNAQVKTPEQFYGYELGARFTPSHQIYRYAEHVAQQLPTKVKLMNYGRTFELRDLVMVVVGSEENIKNLEQIRTDHLKTIGMMDGKPVGTKARPPFIWLSYNVHGDEAVNTEAFSQVLHNLTQSTNPLTDKILKNAIVILAPCLNPDGHDRYVNGFNQKLGQNANPSPEAWEHSQAWPGGRYTHYLFDPNRDWAWQTQEITRLLIAEYHKWMPQIHGDFHEMGPESPYYFAPAAKPFHEDISTWQREAQDIIGGYNKKAFDTQNWLYYTRERFDLLYPSYGDTWPTYNGAIGMTFEQGGGGVAGLAYKRSTEDDTLTLKERIAHVVTASMGTLESIADRPAKVVDEFVAYFQKSLTNPVGAYKSYVVKRSGSEGKVKALCELLDKNKIKYGFALETKPAQGFSFLANKEESFQAENGDLVISAFQPKSTLLKILFEMKPMLEDSLTYDITSWSVPLAYGVRCYGLKDNLLIGTINTPANKTTVADARPLAYIAQWKSAEDAKFLAQLLKNKITLRVSEKPFAMNGKNFGEGTLVITRTNNEVLGNKFDEIIKTNAEKYGITLHSTTTGSPSSGSDFGSDFMYPIKTPRVGVFTGEGTSNMSVGEIWHFFEQDLNYPITLIDPNGRGVGNNYLSKLDVLIVPANSGSIIKETQLPAIKDWVRSGGKLILVENATRQFADKEGFMLKTKKDDKKNEGKAAPDSLKSYANRERAAASDDTPGSIYKLTLDNTHPLAFGFPNFYHALINNVYSYDFLKDGAWNVGYIKSEKDSYTAGFVGKNLKEKIQNSVIFGVEDMGRGKVVYMASDPLFRGFWYNGKLLFANAVFMVN